MSPGSRRSSRSRGTTRRRARGRRTRTEPNSSRSVTRMTPSGPPAKPPLRLRSTSARPPGGERLREAADGRGQDVVVGQQLRQARRLVGGEHDPGTLARASGARSPAGRRWAPAAATARASRTGCHRAAHPRPPAPRSARACGPPAAPLPVARLGVGARPSRWAARRRAPARRAARPPATTGSRPPPRSRPARRGARWPRPGGRAPWPARGSRPTARRRRPGSPSRSAPGPPARRLRAAVSAGRPRRARARARVPVPSRNSLAGSSAAASTGPLPRWSAGSKARRDSISSPNHSTRTGSGWPAGKTSTMPPRRANSPRPPTSGTCS